MTASGSGARPQKRRAARQSAGLQDTAGQPAPAHRRPRAAICRATGRGPTKMSLVNRSLDCSPERCDARRRSSPKSAEVSHCKVLFGTTPESRSALATLSPQQRTFVEASGTSALCRYCCKSRKLNGTKNSTKVDFLTSLPQQSPVTPIRWSVVVFV